MTCIYAEKMARELQTVTINVGAGTRVNNLNINLWNIELPTPGIETSIKPLPDDVMMTVDVAVQTRTIDALSAVKYVAACPTLKQVITTLTEPVKSAAIIKELLTPICAPSIHPGVGIEVGQQYYTVYPNWAGGVSNNPQLKINALDDIKEEPVDLPPVNTDVLALTSNTVWVELGDFTHLATALTAGVKPERIVCVGGWSVAGLPNASLLDHDNCNCLHFHMLPDFEATATVFTQTDVPVYLVGPQLQVVYKLSKEELTSVDGIQPGGGIISSYIKLSRRRHPAKSDLMQLLAAHIATHPQCVAEVHRVACTFDLSRSNLGDYNSRQMLRATRDNSGNVHVITALHQPDVIHNHLFTTLIQDVSA